MQHHDDLIKAHAVRYTIFIRSTCNNAANTRRETQIKPKLFRCLSFALSILFTHSTVFQFCTFPLLSLIPCLNNDFVWIQDRSKSPLQRFGAKQICLSRHLDHHQHPVPLGPPQHLGPGPIQVLFWSWCAFQHYTKCSCTRLRFLHLLRKKTWNRGQNWRDIHNWGPYIN